MWSVFSAKCVVVYCDSCQVQRLKSVHRVESGEVCVVRAKKVPCMNVFVRVESNSLGGVYGGVSDR